MEYTLDQLKTLISSVAGYVVIYEVMDGVCRPVLYTENVPAFSGLTEEEYISLYEKDAAAVVAPADMPVVADKLVRLVSGAGDQEALYRTYHKTRGFVWTHVLFQTARNPQRQACHYGKFRGCFGSGGCSGYSA